METFPFIRNDKVSDYQFSIVFFYYSEFGVAMKNANVLGEFF